MFREPSAHRKRALWRERYQDQLRLYDAVALVAALAGSQLVRFGGASGALSLETVAVPYWVVGAVLAAVWWTWLELRGTREVRLIGYGVEEAKQVVSATLVLFGAIAIVSYAFDIPTARGYVLTALPLGIGTLMVGRFGARRTLMRHRSRGRGLSRTMVVGRFPAATEMVEELRRRPDAGFHPVTVYMPSRARTAPSGALGAGTPVNALPQGAAPSVPGILEACRVHHIETLVLTAAVPLSTREIRHLGWLLADAQIRLVMNTGLTDVAGPRIHTQQLAGLPLIHVATPRFTRSKKIVKRGIDIVGSLAALIVLAPLMLCVALLVKAHDGGPAFFTQERVGIGGNRFRMFKFRSMYVDAEERKATLEAANESDGRMLFKIKEDPRVTRPGRWLRRYSVDELPQLLNVLNGSMSLVGPRPPLGAEVDRYEQHVHRRLRVRPGLTGLWQVSGRADLSWEQSVRLDLYYVENWSLLQDLLILFRTFRAVFTSDGAY